MRNPPKKDRKTSLRIMILGSATLVGLALFGIMVRSSQSNVAPFDPKTCLQEFPVQVDGLKILQGPRTKDSIIRDMQPIVCNAMVLFKQMPNQVMEGTLLIRASVEYTGEVSKVEIVEDTVGSDKLAREVSDFVMDSDFISWARHDDNTEFLYPIRFSSAK